MGDRLCVLDVVKTVRITALHNTAQYSGNCDSVRLCVLMLSVHWYTYNYSTHESLISITYI